MAQQQNDELRFFLLLDFKFRAARALGMMIFLTRESWWLLDMGSRISDNVASVCNTVCRFV